MRGLQCVQRGLVAQLLSFPMGRLWAYAMPNYRLFGTQLNPGPFTIKEHVLVTIMASVGAGSAYRGDVVLGRWRGQARARRLLPPPEDPVPEPHRESRNGQRPSPRSRVPLACRSSCLRTRSRYSLDFSTSVSRVPIVAAIVSSALSLKVSMLSIVA